MWTKLIVFMSRLKDMWARRRLDSDLAEDIENHLALLTDEYVRRGKSLSEARAAARAQFGSVSRVRDHHWEVRGFACLDAWARDVSFAARILRKNPGFSAAAITALALAVGVNATVFAIVNAIHLRGLPVEKPTRVVSVRFAPDDAGRDSGVSFRDFEDFSLAEELESLAAFTRSTFTISGDERAPQQVQGLYISASGFRVLEVSPLIGRYFVPEDDQPAAPPVAVLGSTIWRSRFDADPGVIGRTIRVNGIDATVVGVMPEGFAFDFYADLWQPLALMSGLDREHREARALQLVGKLAEGVTTHQAQAALRALAVDDRLPRVRPFTGTVAEDPMLLFLMLAAGFVLLVACANVAGLLFARAAYRSREIAFRVSLGATRLQIARQLLVESSLLALLAGCAGFLLSVLGVRAFAAAIEGIARPYWIDFTVDWRVLTFLIAVSSISVLLFGLAPALQLWRQVVTARPPRSRIGFALTVTELAVTLVLLANAGLMMRSFLAIYNADLAVDTAQLTTMGLRLPEAEYPTAEERIRFFEQLAETLDSFDEVSSTALSSTVPFANAASRELAIEGLAFPGDALPTVAFLTIGPRYFETLGVGLLQGRELGERDGLPGYQNVIVNDALASHYFADGDALGRRIRLIDPRSSHETAWLSIVGVAPTMRHRRFQPEPTAYLPYRHTPGASVRLIVRGSRGGEDTIVPVVREAVRQLDAELPIFAVMTGDELRSQSRWPYRVIGGMLVVFALIALIVAAVGLYAVTAYSVASRTHELAIRRALGAAHSDVTWLVARPMSLQLAFGLVLGGIGALAAGTLLSSFLVDTSAADIATIVTVTLVLSIVAGVAGLAPARRAMRLDPATALRYE